MGIRTDLTSLGAIGLGTAIAVVGSGALLFAGVSNSIDADVCIDMPAPPEAPAPAPDASITVAKLSESGDVSVSVAVSDAPDAPRTITISEQVVVRSGCVDALRSDVHEVRVRALADVDQVRMRADEVRMRADEARILADEIRAEVERARADGRDVSRSSSDEIRELVDAALAEAGVRDRRR